MFTFIVDRTDVKAAIPVVATIPTDPREAHDGWIELCDYINRPG